MECGPGAAPGGIRPLASAGRRILGDNPRIEQTPAASSRNHSPPFLSFDAAGDGGRPFDCGEPALRPARTRLGPRWLRGAAPWNAAVVAAFGDLLFAAVSRYFAARVLGRRVRVGDQLFGLRGRELPGRLAGNPAWADGRSAFARHEHANRASPGDRPA